MIINNSFFKEAENLDKADPLKHFRKHFLIDENLIYLDGNSLGCMPIITQSRINRAVSKEWANRLIRSWNESWINLPEKVGAKIAKIIGARPDEVIIADSTSINLFKLAYAALNAQKSRTRIISDNLNFPSDIYVFQSLIDIFNNRISLELVESRDGISVSTDKIKNSLDDNTTLLSLSHVAFKSAFKYDINKITKLAHNTGAMVLWDLSHSAGVVPVELNKNNVDLAVGCTYKYLNGGPGSPAFLFIRKDLQEKLLPPVWGWFGDKKPFEFNLDFEPGKNIKRFWTGTPPVLSLSAIEPGLDIIIEAGIDNVRKKSITQTEFLIKLIKHFLIPINFTIGTPEEDNDRGSHVSIRHPEAYRITKALINPEKNTKVIIPDFRAPDNIRLGIAPLYISFEDIYEAIIRIKTIVENKIYENYDSSFGKVT